VSGDAGAPPLQLAYRGGRFLGLLQVEVVLRRVCEQAFGESQQRAKRYAVN